MRQKLIQNLSYECFGVISLFVLILLFFQILFLSTATAQQKIPVINSEAQSAATDQGNMLLQEEQALPLLPTTIAGLPVEQVLNSSSYLKILEKTVLEYEQKLGACATPVYEGRSAIGAPQVARAFPEDGVVPQWIEIVQIGGCQTAYTRSVLVGVVKDAPRFHPLIVGNALSLLDLTVEKDVLKTLVKSELRLSKQAGCSETQSIRIHETRLVSQQSQKDSLIWQEEWLIENCKGKKTLTLDFRTDPENGTQFSITQGAIGGVENFLSADALHPSKEQISQK